MGNERGEERDNEAGGKEWLTIKSLLPSLRGAKRRSNPGFFGIIAQTPQAI
jgi:hypothetical protein